MPSRSSSARSRSSASTPPAVKIVGIGASAGGLEAFTELVRNLPTDAHLAYVLVQHLDPTHRSLLSELLGRSASLPVREIENGIEVQPNQIYVIPPNSHLAITRGVLQLSPREKKPGPARSIDHFLKSLAADQGRDAVGVILSGAGSDGAKGLKAIKEAGGVTFAQDAATAKYDSMPRSAVATGCVDFVLPPQKIAAEIARTVARPGSVRTRAAANARNRVTPLAGSNRRSTSTNEKLEELVLGPTDPELRKIFQLLRTKTGLDFSHYRINTIRRRLKRRLALQKLGDLRAYHRLLQEDPAELDLLHRDLLIGVTSFFRNPGMFAALHRKVFPKLVKDRDRKDPLRFWIAGCSTGQEAYSFAIAFTEYCEKASVRAPFQIFATDVNATALEIARAGRYTKTQLAGLTSSQVSRHFDREAEQYRVQKSLRDSVIFAQHNLLTDPPFTRVNLISCRNLLIYVEPALQQRILPVFHYAIRGDGFLVLGTSESAGSFPKFFTPVDKPQKIYAKKPVASPVTLERPPINALRLAPGRPAPRATAEAAPNDLYREADQLTLARFAPAGVLVSEEGEILQFRGKVQPFLTLPTGKASLNVLKLARGGLALSIQRALFRARKENRPIRERAISFNGPRQLINLEVLPVKSAAARCFLVLFEKIAPARLVTPPGSVEGRSRNTAAGQRELAELRREYNETRHLLENLREQHDTAVEELQASNEEVQSSNEELQSLNEELETSNEELESANEELTTLNEELATRNTELRESEQRLREQAQLVDLAPLLARSAKDRIIFWNRGAEKLYGFSKEEALGQTSHLLLAAQYPMPLADIQAQLVQHGRWEGEVLHRRKDGLILTISTQWVVQADEDNKLRAILEVNTDITARKRAEESLRHAQELNQRILESSPDCLLVLDLGGRIQFLNRSGQRALDAGELNAVTGSHWLGLWTEEARGAADSAYRAALSGETFRFQGVSQAPKSLRWWDVVVLPILDAAGHPEQLLATCRDVTDRKRAELAALEEARLASLRADVAVEVARGGDLGPILQQLAQLILHHAEAAHVRIWLTSDENTLELTASAGLFAQLNSHEARIALGEGRVGTIAASKRPHVTHQVAADPDIGDPEFARREGIISFAGFPLLFESQLLGVVAVLSRHRIEPRLVRELGLSCDAVALLIQRKRAEDARNRLLQEAMTARNEAVTASRAKDDFLATLSHELRTPLNPVLLLASDAAEDPSLPPDIRSTFETIRNNVVLEAKLIDDLLDLTRIARGKLTLDLERVDMNRSVADAVNVVMSELGKRSIKIELNLEPTPAYVIADPVRLQQVFWNVLNNAVKFTPHGGLISVRSWTTPAGRAVVQVRDTGIGMRPEHLAHIFDAFSQVERRSGGLGLGLSISRQLIEALHGTIRALSDGLGKGSTFEIELPLDPETTVDGVKRGADGGESKHAGTKRRSARVPSGDGASRRLLLIEDHASTRNALRRLLTARHFEVEVASSLAEARKRMEKGPYDLVISDLGLPDGDGHTLIAELTRQQPELRAIALSGFGTIEDRARSRAAGFRGHLTKPVTIDALDQVIRETLNSDEA